MSIQFKQTSLARILQSNDFDTNTLSTTDNVTSVNFASSLDTTGTRLASISYAKLKSYAKNSTISISIHGGIGAYADSYGGSTTGSIIIYLTDGTTNLLLASVSCNAYTGGSHYNTQTSSCSAQIVNVGINLKDKIIRSGSVKYNDFSTGSYSGQGSASVNTITDNTSYSALNEGLITLQIQHVSSLSKKYLCNINTTVVVACA